MNTPADIYGSRLADREAVVAGLDRRHERLANVRLALAGLAVALLLWRGQTAMPWLAATALAFVVVAVYHSRVLAARTRAMRAVHFYRRGLDCLHDRWAGTGATGEQYVPDDHPAARDLDLFGEGSLFQRLASPRTDGGEATLARWLLAPATPGEVVRRQGAVRELAPRLDLREDLFVLAPDITHVVATESLVAWAVAPPQVPAWIIRLTPLLVVASVSALSAWAASGEPPAWMLPALLLQGLVATWLRPHVRTVLGSVEQRAADLQLLARLLRRLEQESVDTPRLTTLAHRLTSTGRPASVEIAHLARLVDVLSSRRNQFFAPFAALLLLGTHGAWAVERWRTRCGAAVAGWIEALGEYEALLALAGLAFERPDDGWPEVVEGAPCFDAEAVAHPLLPAATAVANTVRLGGEHPHVLLVSGSNMSGKSTLLRTVGITAALAHAGGPVRARRLVMTPLDIGATLRIQDSLQEGQSRFFAEISRIALIVRMARRAAADERAPRVLFLLDEVLAGTNSHDRQQGAAAIIRGLVDLGAIGIVTTHDLAVTSLVGTMGNRAHNVHFEDRFEGEALHFDYHLREGVVQTSNAIALMRSVGLDV